MCWWLWKRKGWWLWCSFVLAQIHVGIPRSMHCLSKCPNPRSNKQKQFWTKKYQNAAMCWWLWKRKGWWLWCSFVLAQIHVGIPRSMHCWHCSESYHFVGFEIRITPNYWKTKRPPHYLLTWKIATQIVEQKKAMKIPGMPTLHCFIAVENDVLWRQINKCYSFKEVTFFVLSVVQISEGLSAFKQTDSFTFVQRFQN